MATKTIAAGKCPHHRKCSGAKVGPHDADCPTRRGLTDTDVLFFVKQHCEVETRSNEGRLTRIVRGKYKGATASTTGTDPEDLRWLAEHLVDYVATGKASS